MNPESTGGFIVASRVVGQRRPGVFNSMVQGEGGNV